MGLSTKCSILTSKHLGERRFVQSLRKNHSSSRLDPQVPRTRPPHLFRACRPGLADDRATASKQNWFRESSAASWSRPLACDEERQTKETEIYSTVYIYIYICMYTVLYYIMLYKISYIVVLYYTILYYIILYCFILYYCILYLSYYILYIVYVYLCWGCQKMGDCPPIGHQMSMTARPQLQWG